MGQQPHVVFFDAGLTLLVPRRPIAVLYHEAALRHGGCGSREAFATAIATQWPAFSRYFETNGWLTVSSDEIEGLAWRWFTDRVADQVGEDRLDRAGFNEDLVELFGQAATWSVFDDVPATLDRLGQSGIRCGLISNWDTGLRSILAVHGLLDRFDPVLISSEVGIRKPHPDLFRSAARKAGCPPEACWHVGDSDHDDARAAAAAGFTGILLDREGRQRIDDGVIVAGGLEEVARWACEGRIPGGVRGEDPVGGTGSGSGQDRQARPPR